VAQKSFKKVNQAKKLVDKEEDLIFLPDFSTIESCEIKR
jgi:hypothetical protein